MIYALDEGTPWILLIKRKNDPFKGGWALPGESTWSWYSSISFLSRSGCFFAGKARGVFELPLRRPWRTRIRFRFRLPSLIQPDFVPPPTNQNK